MSAGTFLLLLLLLLLFSFDRLLGEVRVLGLGGTGSGTIELLAAVDIEGGAHAHVDGEALPGVSLINPAHGRHIAVIPAESDADVARSYGLAQGGIQSDPYAGRPAGWQVGFGPSMRCLSASDFFDALLALSGWSRDQVAGDISARHAAHADDPEKQMREILANPRP